MITYSMKKYVSSIGLGCVTFGREINKLTSFVLMDYAYAKGITFFDTASAYGAGGSEIIVGEWLAAHRTLTNSITIATKLLPPYEPKHIIASVEGSLRRLGTDTIDLLYLHRWHPSLNSIAGLETFNDLIRDGKVRTLGASNFNAEQLENALRRQMDLGFEHFRFVQNNHNLAVRNINEEIRKICTEHGMEIVTYSPLGAGFLTGKYQKGIPKDTRFAIVPGHKDIYFNKIAIHRFTRIQKISSRTGYSTAHLALAWALHQPGITSVLIGTRSIAHLDQAFTALAFDDPGILAELELI